MVYQALSHNIYSVPKNIYTRLVITPMFLTLWNEYLLKVGICFGATPNTSLQDIYSLGYWGPLRVYLESRWRRSHLNSDLSY